MTEAQLANFVTVLIATVGMIISIIIGYTLGRNDVLKSDKRSNAERIRHVIDLASSRLRSDLGYTKADILPPDRLHEAIVIATAEQCALEAMRCALNLRHNEVYSDINLWPHFERLAFDMTNKIENLYKE